MLIEFLFEKFSNWEDVNETAVGDLQVGENIEILSILVGFNALVSFTNSMLHFAFEISTWTKQVQVISGEFVCAVGN